MSEAQAHDVYYDLAKRLDDPDVIKSVPEILRYLVTEEEAGILLGLPEGRLATAEEVREAVGAELEAVEKALWRAYEIGILACGSTEGGERTYGYADIYVDSICGDPRNNVHGEEYRRLWAQWTEEQIKRRDAARQQSLMGGGRVLPYEEVFHDHNTSTVIPYDDAREIVENSRVRAVGQCPCKYRSGGCKYPMDDICMFLDHMAEMCLERGSHREISKEEALAVLKRTAEAGLVHMSGQSRFADSSNGAEFICSCCGCCCAFFEHYLKYPEEGKILSNYYCEVDPELCTGCGECVDRCFVEATYVADGVCVIDQDKCLGCGVCAYVCERKAKSVRKKKGAPVPHPTAHRHFIEPRVAPGGKPAPKPKEN